MWCGPLAEGGPDPCGELRWGEGFDHVVGSAHVEGPGDQVVLAVHREEDDGHVLPPEDRFHHLQAVVSRQHEV